MTPVPFTPNPKNSVLTAVRGGPGDVVWTGWVVTAGVPGPTFVTRSAAKRSVDAHAKTSDNTELSKVVTWSNGRVIGLQISTGSLFDWKLDPFIAIGGGSGGLPKLSPAPKELGCKKASRVDDIAALPSGELLVVGRACAAYDDHNPAVFAERFGADGRSLGVTIISKAVASAVNIVATAPAPIIEWLVPRANDGPGDTVVVARADGAAWTVAAPTAPIMRILSVVSDRAGGVVLSAQSTLAPEYVVVAVAPDGTERQLSLPPHVSPTQIWANAPDDIWLAGKTRDVTEIWRSKKDAPDLVVTERANAPKK